MALPFLNPKKVASVIIAKTKPDGGVEPMHEEGEKDPGLIAAAESLLSAISLKDASAVAQALEDAISVCGYGQEEA